jgi:hypothetical protein
MLQLQQVVDGASGKAMKLSDEPNNWIGLGMLLLLIVVFALVIHWLGLPKLPA